MNFILILPTQKNKKAEKSGKMKHIRENEGGKQKHPM